MAASPGSGRVFQINSSAGGVPKLPRPVDHVGREGLGSDAQAHPGVHGGPERAVCLYSLEHILALQAEGHPVYPGAMGENLTLSGLDWEELEPGARLRIGADVELEVSSYTVPCKAIASCFLGGEQRRVGQSQHPGWSRLYARVLREGSIQVGDPVRRS